MLVLGFLVGRLLGLGPRLAFLVATGNAICGNSAIAAVAPVIRAEKRDVAGAIGLTAVIGLGLVLGLPFLIPPLTLSHFQYGILAGMGVYAVPQVVAAAFPVSQLSGEVATLVKLGRVMMLGSDCGGGGCMARWPERVLERRAGHLPAVVRAGLRRSGRAAERRGGPRPVAQPLRGAGGWLIVLAMAGLGLGVRAVGDPKRRPARWGGRSDLAGSRWSG